MGALELNDVIRINFDMIKWWGGSHNGADNLCNAGSLLWCLDAITNGYYTTDVERAAVLIETIAGKHCFYDGNKRTAVFAAYLYLENLGYMVDMPDYDEMREYVIGIIQHTVTREMLTDYLSLLIDKDN